MSLAGGPPAPASSEPGELIVRNVRPMAGPSLDVLARGARIAHIGPRLDPRPGATVIDGHGAILLPAFVDAHMHLDKTFWNRPWRPHGAGPSVRDRIEHERRLRRELGLDPAAQAEQLARAAIGRGTVHIRTHVDIDTETGLGNLEGVVAARRKLAGAVGIQIVAFPQSGVVTRPGTADLLDRALQDGAELIGGIDPIGIDGDAAGQLDTVFGLAARHGSGVDIHLHDGGAAGAQQIRMIAERTRALGLGGKVAVSHAFCLGMVDEAEFGALAGLLAENRIAVMSAAPGDRAMPPLRRLREAGVVVFSGSDGVRDAWTPYGNADMLERAMLLAYRSGFRTDELLQASLDIATRGGATAMGLDGYGLEVGCRADFAVVAGETLGELVVARPPRAWVVSGGRVVARDGHCVI